MSDLSVIRHLDEAEGSNGSTDALADHQEAERRAQADATRPAKAAARAR